ncbi:uncharacterized protein AB9W97_017136 [Spinachia spinachia]
MLSLSLWLALMMSSGRVEETSTLSYLTDNYPTDEYPTDDYPTDEYPTDEYPTDEYDYTATFDYSFVTGPYRSDVNGQASRVAGVSPLLLLGWAVHQMWS